MKVGLFSDPHYSTAPVTCEKRYNNQSLLKIQTALNHFQAENCDLVICLGDLIDTEENHVQEIINLQKVAPFFMLLRSRSSLSWEIMMPFDLKQRNSIIF